MKANIINLQSARQALTLSPNCIFLILFCFNSKLAYKSSHLLEFLLFLAFKIKLIPVLNSQNCNLFCSNILLVIIYFPSTRIAYLATIQAKGGLVQLLDATDSWYTSKNLCVWWTFEMVTGSWYVTDRMSISCIFYKLQNCSSFSLAPELEQLLISW